MHSNGTLPVTLPLPLPLDARCVYTLRPLLCHQIAVWPFRLKLKCKQNMRYFESTCHPRKGRFGCKEGRRLL